MLITYKEILLNMYIFSFHNTYNSMRLMSV